MASFGGSTWFNRIYLAVLAAGAVGCAAAGQVAAAVALLVPVGFAVWGIRRSLLPQASDGFRVGMAQPLDERERSASAWSFAVVGMFAIMMETVSFTVELARGHHGGAAWWHLVAVGAAWAVANLVAVRRV